MKQFKENQLFAAARREPPIEPPQDFASSVVSALHRDSTQQRCNDSTMPLWDILASLFPRSAVAALAIIALSAATDLYFAWHQGPADMAQAAEEWFFSAQ